MSLHKNLMFPPFHAEHSAYETRGSASASPNRNNSTNKREWHRWSFQRADPESWESYKNIKPKEPKTPPKPLSRTNPVKQDDRFEESRRQLVSLHFYPMPLSDPPSQNILAMTKSLSVLPRSIYYQAFVDESGKT
jgi:hypothetical protein